MRHFMLRLCPAVQRYAHEEFPVFGLGFDSLEDMVSSVPDVMIQKKGKGESARMYKLEIWS